MIGGWSNSGYVATTEAIAFDKGRREFGGIS